MLLVVLGLLINSFRGGGGKGAGNAAAQASQPQQYKPLGIVPKSYILWRDANTALTQNAPDKALPLLNELEMRNPADAEVHLAMGKTYYRLKKTENAFEEYRKALQLDSELRKDGELISQLIEALGSSEWAEVAGEILSDLVGDAAEKQLPEAVAGKDQTKSRNAQSVLANIWAKMVVDNPKDVPTRLKLARAQYRLGNHEKAINAYRQVLLDQPEERNNPELIMQLIEMLGGSQASKAMSVLAKLVGQPAIESLKKQSSSGRTGAMRKNSAQTINLIHEEQAISDPNNAQAPLDLAFQRAAKKNYTEALEYLAIALKRNPSFASDPKVLKLTFDALQTDDSQLAINILVKQIGEPAIPQLKQALASNDSSIRWNAAAALKAMGKGAEVDQIALLKRDLTDDNSSCYERKKALAKLESSKDPRAADIVKKAEDNPLVKKCTKGRAKEREIHPKARHVRPAKPTRSTRPARTARPAKVSKPKPAKPAPKPAAKPAKPAKPSKPKAEPKKKKRSLRDLNPFRRKNKE
jgi:tetratricopeptide (TPR) repeat protein